MSQVLLINPPVSKPGELPLGLARLKSSLLSVDVTSDLIDANIEGLSFLLNQPLESNDNWTQEASAQTHNHVESIQKGTAFQSIDHYNRIVRDLGRVVQYHGMKHGFHLGLADISHASLSTAKSHDLLWCAEHPGTNPFFSYYDEILLPRIELINPELIGLSIQFLSQAFCAFALIGLIRKRIPNVKLIAGGGLITSWMQLSTWNEPFKGLLDICVSGPGEPFFLEYFKSSNLQADNPTPELDPFQKNQYLSPGFVLPYNTSSGCYWRKCNFCPECAEENRYGPIPHDQVLNDLTELSQNQMPSLIHFLDNALAPAFLNRLIENPLSAPWYGYVRFHENLEDLDYCMQLKASGCVMLKLGLESGDQSVLDAMKKGIELEAVSRILSNLKQVGIDTFVYLLFGTPYESENQARATLDFTVQHADKMGFINPAIFNMPIESKETDQFITRRFSEGDLSLYVDFEHPTDWDRLRVRHFLDREFKRNDAIAKILRRTPKIFTSNHAPFFSMK